jgi:hypothetical protein
MGYLIEIDLSPPRRIFPSAEKWLPALLRAKGKARSPLLDAAEKHKRHICKKTGSKPMKKHASPRH